MKRYLYFFLITLGTICCSNPINDKSISINTATRPYDDLQKLIVFNGDTNAYEELSIQYFDHDHQDEFLIYALVMANKYDYAQAYFDVFYCLTLPFYGTGAQIDEKTAHIAIVYLIEAADKGHHQAMRIVMDLSKYDGKVTDKQKLEKYIAQFAK